MAAPTITWKQYTTSLVASEAAITVLSLGTVTAGAFSDNKCIKVAVAGNDVTNIKLWLADSTAVVNGSPVSLGKAGKAWEIVATATSTIGGQSALFLGDGSLITGAGTTLATDYSSAPNNSLGAGKSLGTGVTNVVSASSKSKAAFLSVKPHASAYDGEHTGFSFQVGYEFS